jgi:tRNA G10  N-methylase Trm11
MLECFKESAYSNFENSEFRRLFFQYQTFLEKLAKIGPNLSETKRGDITWKPWWFSKEPV